jgi:hypothetical protein
MYAHALRSGTVVYTCFLCQASIHQLFGSLGSGNLSGARADAGDHDALERRRCQDSE